MSIAKQILLNELEENTHPEKVEDVIFWALEYYAKQKEGFPFGKLIAHSIVDRIKREELEQPAPESFCSFCGDGAVSHICNRCTLHT